MESALALPQGGGSAQKQGRPASRRVTRRHRGRSRQQLSLGELQRRAEEARARHLAERAASFHVVARCGGFPEASLGKLHKRVGRRLRPTERVLYPLVRRAERQGYPGLRATAAQLAGLLDCSERSVRRALVSLGPCNARCAPECVEHLDLVQTVAQYEDTPPWRCERTGRVYCRRKASSVYVLGRLARRPCRPKRSFFRAAAGQNVTSTSSPPSCLGRRGRKDAGPRPQAPAARPQGGVAPLPSPVPAAPASAAARPRDGVAGAPPRGAGWGFAAPARGSGPPASGGELAATARDAAAGAGGAGADRAGGPPEGPDALRDALSATHAELRATGRCGGLGSVTPRDGQRDAPGDVTPEEALRDVEDPALAAILGGALAAWDRSRGGDA